MTANKIRMSHTNFSRLCRDTQPEIRLLKQDQQQHESLYTIHQRELFFSAFVNPTADYKELFAEFQHEYLLWFMFAGELA